MGRSGGGGGGHRYPSEDRPDGKKVLARISKETGGELFQVSKKLSIDQIYAQIEEELRNQYSIGYTPTNPTGDGSFRHIDIKTDNSDYHVQARAGYYATKHDEQ